MEQQKRRKIPSIFITLALCVVSYALGDVMGHKSGHNHGKIEALAENKSLIELGQLAMKTSLKCEEKENKVKLSCNLYEESEKPNYSYMLHVGASVELCLEHKQIQACNSLCSQHNYKAFCGIDPHKIDLHYTDCKGNKEERGHRFRGYDEKTPPTSSL